MQVISEKVFFPSSCNVKLDSQKYFDFLFLFLKFAKNYIDTTLCRLVANFKSNTDNTRSLQSSE